VKLALIEKRIMFTLVLFVIAALGRKNNNIHKLDDVEVAWRQWNKMYEKHDALASQVYLNGENKDRRFEVFSHNYAIVKMHNSLANSTYTMELNQFAGLSHTEFAGFYNGYDQDLKLLSRKSKSKHKDVRPAYNGSELPTSVDWREENLVTPIKDQKQCGSCWAFSTIVSLEGQLAKATGKLVSLSEQDLVDCVKDQKIHGSVQKCCMGCNGGLMDYAFEYMIEKQSGEDEAEIDYEYTARDGTCDFKANKAYAAAKISKYTDVQKGMENLADAVANVGPISVAVDANTAWQLYHSGILDPITCNKNRLDHGVAIVGYGSQRSKDYWIVRNSWGKSWGEKGYVRLAKGDNTCGIQNGPPSYPTTE